MKERVKKIKAKGKDECDSRKGREGEGGKREVKYKRKKGKEQGEKVERVTRFKGQWTELTNPNHQLALSYPALSALCTCVSLPCSVQPGRRSLFFSRNTSPINIYTPNPRERVKRRVQISFWKWTRKPSFFWSGVSICVMPLVTGIDAMKGDEGDNGARDGV